MLVVHALVFAQEKETQIEEVSIVSKIPEERYKTGKNVQLLTELDLQKYKGQNLNDVLEQVSGIQITGNFNNQSEPKSMKIRGGRSANVLILLDGVPLKDVTGNDYNVSDLRLLALEDIAYIEVLNGASSVVYGSNASVSVINIKTKKASQKKIEGLLSARGGSYSTFAQNLSIRGKLNQFNYQISGFNEKSQGISAAKGDNFDDDGWEKQNVNARVGYASQKIEANINAGWSHHLFKYDNSAFQDGENRGDDSQLFIGGNFSYQYHPKSQMVLNVRNTTIDRVLQNFDGTRYQDQTQYKGSDFFGEVYNAYRFNDYVNLIGGIQYEKQAMESSSIPYGESEMKKVLNWDDANIYTIDEFMKVSANYKGFNLDAGVRFNYHSKYHGNWVYSINPFYLKEFNADYLKVGYSYATAFIAPTLFQNFGYGQWGIVPNPDLKPETNASHEVDLAFGNKNDNYSVEVSLFQRKEKDIMVFAYLPDYSSQYQNLDEGKAKGFDVSAHYRFRKTINIGGNFSYVERDQEAAMLRIPKQRANAFLEVQPFKKTAATLSYQFVGKRKDYYYDANFVRQDVVLKSFGLFNLNVNQKIADRFEAFANIGNLFNVSYVDVVGYNTKRRNYTIGFSYRF